MVSVLNILPVTLNDLISFDISQLFWCFPFRYENIYIDIYRYDRYEHIKYENEALKVINGSALCVQ